MQSSCILIDQKMDQEIMDNLDENLDAFFV